MSMHKPCTFYPVGSLLSRICFRLGKLAVTRRRRNRHNRGIRAQRQEEGYSQLTPLAWLVRTPYATVADGRIIGEISA